MVINNMSSNNDDFSLSVGIDVSIAKRELEKLEKLSKKITKEELSQVKAQKELNKKLAETRSLKNKINLFNNKSDSPSDGGDKTSTPIGGISSAGLKTLKTIGVISTAIFAVKGILNKINNEIKKHFDRQNRYFASNLNPVKAGALNDALYSLYGGDKDSIAKQQENFSRKVMEAVTGNASELTTFNLAGVSLFDKSGTIRDSIDVLREVLNKGAELENDIVKRSYANVFGISDPAYLKALGVGSELSKEQLKENLNNEIKKYIPKARLESLAGQKAETIQKPIREAGLQLSKSLTGAQLKLAGERDTVKAVDAYNKLTHLLENIKEFNKPYGVNNTYTPFMVYPPSAEKRKTQGEQAVEELKNVLKTIDLNKLEKIGLNKEDINNVLNRSEKLTQNITININSSGNGSGAPYFDVNKAKEEMESAVKSIFNNNFITNTLRKN